MKKITSTLFVCLTLLLNLSAQQTEVNSLQGCNTKVEGNYGKIIHLAIENRINAQDIDDLVNPFKTRNECRFWQTEFWGKWMASAVDAYLYQPNPLLKQKIEMAVKELLATQTPDGYIGNYADTCQLQRWDVWGRKYTMLGLLKWYGVTKDENILHAASRVADHLMGQTGPGKTDLYKTGNFRGMPSSTVLEPMVLLYKATKNEKYLNYCRYIIDQWENTPDGPKLISKALDNVPVAERFPVENEKDWWSWKNGQKAYEMMNCYKSLLDFYEIEPNPDYLQAALNTANDIIENEINIAGSGASYECWYHGKHHQTQAAVNTMETCATFTWMQLCARLFSLTADARWADQFEISAYNAMPASMRNDGATFMKYPALCGQRSESYPQPGMDFLNCCIANGPRGFVLVPPLAVMQRTNEVYINFYSALHSEVKLEKGNSVILQQTTDYPQNGDVKIVVSLKKDAAFVLKLRVPSFSNKTTISINGKTVSAKTEKGYLCVDRKWKNGDMVEIAFDMNPRMEKQDGHIAFMFGPVLLAADQRFNKDDVDEVVSLPSGQKTAQLEKLEPRDGCQLFFKTRLRKGTYLEDEAGQPRELFFCDFASAGDTWDAQSRYRVWLPLILFPTDMK